MKKLLNNLYSESKFISCKFRKYDFEIDLKMLDKYKGKDFVFLSRESGTQLYPLNSGVNPHWLTGYKEYDNVEWFHIVAGEEPSAKRITSDDAVKLINQLPHAPHDERALINHVWYLLDDVNVISSGLVTPSISNSGPLNWIEWINWFSKADNVVMKKYMQNAVRTLKV